MKTNDKKEKKRKEKKRKGARIFPFPNVCVWKRFQTFDSLHEHEYYVLSPPYMHACMHTYVHTTYTHTHTYSSCLFATKWVGKGIVATTNQIFI